MIYQNNWVITPNPKDASDKIMVEYYIDNIIRNLPGYYWPGTVRTFCGCKIEFKLESELEGMDDE